MDVFKELDQHLVERWQAIQARKEAGDKCIGYLPSSLMPEELLQACGAVPVPLIRGGEPEAVTASRAWVPRFVDTFMRAQAGYRFLAEEPAYQIIDSVAVAISDNNTKVVADTFEHYASLKVIRLGVPHENSQEAYQYYLQGLRLVKEQLENFTGAEITDEKIWDAIRISNEMNRLLEQISSVRCRLDAPLTGKDFIRLVHGSYMAEPARMIDILKSALAELNGKEGIKGNFVRILITGSTLAVGDYKVVDLVEELGGMVVFEQFAEGIREYWERIPEQGDPLEALASRYIKQSVPPPFWRPAKERHDFIIRKAKECSADAVIWYQLMYRDGYDIESWYFPQILEERANLPMLKLESDYDASERRLFRTRIEALIESASGRRNAYAQ